MRAAHLASLLSYGADSDPVAVTSFDEFLGLKGCATGSHSLEKEVAAPKPAPAAVAPSQLDADGKEVYGGAAPAATTSTLPPLPPAPTPTAAMEPAKPVSTEYVEEQDDPELPCVKGATCKRRSCGVSWDGESREGEECRYHPGGVRRSRLPLARASADCSDRSRSQSFTRPQRFALALISFLMRTKVANDRTGFQLLQAPHAGL